MKHDVQEHGEANAIEELEYKKPEMYAVLIYNDDYTTMDFVVEGLVSVFNKSADEAVQIMLQIHNQGKGVAGVYIYDIAVTKKNQMERMAAAENFPLMLSIEEETL